MIIVVTITEESEGISLPDLIVFLTIEMKIVFIVSILKCFNEEIFIY